MNPPWATTNPMNIHLSSIKQALHWHIWLRTEISWRRPMWNRLTLEKKISSWKLMTSPFSSWIHLFPIKNCSIYNSTVFFINLVNIWCLYVLGNFWGELNIAAPMSSWPRPTTIFKKSNFNHGACLKDIPMKSFMLVAQIQWNQQAEFQGKYEILTGSLPLEMYSNSMCRQPAPVCLAMGEIRYNTAGNPWQNEKFVRWKYKTI